MKTIDEYRTCILILLGDTAGRRYSETQLDLALQEALRQLDSYRSNKETVKVRIAETSGPTALLRWVPAPDAQLLSVRSESGRLYSTSDHRTGGKTWLQFFGDTLPKAGETLQLELTRPHIIQGLNGEQTTVPESLALTVCSGAAGFAMRIRARSVTEVFGKRPEDTERLIEQSQTLISEYLDELSAEDRKEGLHRPPWPERGFPI